jgi:hypothetical protein
MTETMDMAGVILLDEDDFMHPVEEASNFNESAYYNFFNHEDPTLGGWLRIGNRPNEGYAEVTVVLYEPDGTVGFQFKRPRIDNNKSHQAGGARFEVVEPWREHRATYNGHACVLQDPLELRDPSTAFRENPHEPVEVDIRWRGLSPGWGGERRRRLPDGGWESVGRGDLSAQFARGHFEQLGSVVGTMSVGDRSYAINGYGLRDHSWGPRYWQNTGPYQWLTMNFGDELGMMGYHGDVPGLGERTHGFVWEKGGEIRPIGLVEIETEYKGEDHIHDQIRARLYPVGRDDPYEVTGRVLSVAPCRNRRSGWVTRICEAMTEWKMGDRIGYGVSEYLTHLKTGD